MLDDGKKKFIYLPNGITKKKNSIHSFIYIFKMPVVSLLGELKKKKKY